MNPDVMKLVNNINVNVFCSPEEEGKIKKTLISLFPFDLKENKMQIAKRTATGFEEKKIVILKVTLEKQKHTNEFLNSLAEKLSKDQKELLMRQLNSRLDEDCNFFIRLDREKLMQNEFWITDSGDCFHIRMNIAAFPKKRENAINILKKLFKS